MEKNKKPLVIGGVVIVAIIVLIVAMLLSWYATRSYYKGTTGKAKLCGTGSTKT